MAKGLTAVVYTANVRRDGLELVPPSEGVRSFIQLAGPATIRCLLVSPGRDMPQAALCIPAFPGSESCTSVSSLILLRPGASCSYMLWGTLQQHYE